MIMKVKMMILAGLLAAACNSQASEFKMKIDRIDELNGFILKGLSITGTAEQGCISHDNEVVVTRDGKEVLKTVARILLVEGLQEGEEIDGEAYNGEVISFYLPDMKKGAVEIGDWVIAKETTCKKSKRR
jgi:selenocysteine-specific translation elongation factor